jgi:hypothetical protein
VRGVNRGAFTARESLSKIDLTDVTKKDDRIKKLHENLQEMSQQMTYQVQNSEDKSK